MVNDDWIGARGGLLPLGYPFGNFKINYYRLTTGAATVNIFIGHPLDADANGRVAAQVPGSNNLLIGPALGFLDTNLAAPPSGMLTTSAAPYLPGNTDAYVAVCDDPNQIFVMQEDTGGTALVLTDNFTNVDWIFRSTSGSTTTGYSTAEINRDGVNTGTGGALMLVGPTEYMNQDATRNTPGNYCKWNVRIFNHRLAAKGQGTAV